MRPILKELFYGNICPSNYYNSSELTKQLMGYVSNHYDNLKETLTDKQREELEKYEDCYLELTDIDQRETFMYAFKSDMRITIEALYPDENLYTPNVYSLNYMTVIICALLLLI